MQNLTASDKYTAAPVRLGEPDPYPDRVAGEFVCRVVSNDMVNEANRLLVLDAPERALRAKAGQFFHLLCPTPDGAEVWMRRPMSIYRIDRPGGRLEFLYKCEGRGTLGMSLLEPGGEFNIAGRSASGSAWSPAGRTSSFSAAASAWPRSRPCPSSPPNTMSGSPRSSARARPSS